tara:strand:+ start:712 stop:3837 length:3126 start_codon:yes stop_codon:yes gene_type:complete
MSVYKKIASNDVKVTPFQVHKNWLINASNYSASYGVQMLEGNYHSYSFADTRRGKDIKFEATNSNGLYKSIIWDSQNHLYYERPNNPSENFGTSVPEDEERFIYEKIRTISIPSFIYDEQVKKSSFRLTDHYMTNLNWDSTGSRLLGHWKFETSSIDGNGGNTNMLLTSSAEYIGNTPFASTFTSSNSENNYNFFNGPFNDTPSSRVGSGSMKTTNNCGAILIPSQSFFTGSSAAGFTGPDLFTLTGSQEYTITMWLKPGAAPAYESHSATPVNVDLNGTHSGSVIISRDRHKYFEIRQLTGSFDAPNGRVGLQMYWGASSSNATTTNNVSAIDQGLYLTSGSWNLVTLTQKFMPHIGTSGSMENDDLLTVGKYKQLPAWGYSGETRLRIYHKDPTDPRGFSVYESSSFMQAGGSGASVGSGSTGEEISFTNVTSSNQYHRHIVLGCSASAITDDKFTHTIEPKEGNWSGSYDDIRFFGSTLSRERTDNLWRYADMNMENVPPVTASIDVYDDGKGNLRDRNIPTGSFVSMSNLIGYWGFNEKYRQKGRRLGSRGSLKNNQANFGTKIFTSSINTGTDKYVYEKTGITQNVSFIDGIRVTEQSGSNWNTEAINYYYTDVPSGFAARFNNSYRSRMGRGNYIPRFAKGTFTSSIRIDHYDEINFRKDDEFAISCWIQIPEQQEDHPNVIYYGPMHVTSSGGHYPTPQGNADATHTISGNAPGDCNCHSSGSGNGTDWCDIIIKAGLGKLAFENSVTREIFTEDTKQDMLNKFPFHIRLRNNNHESCELKINTISAGRSDGANDVYVESKIPLTPRKWHHIVFQKKGFFLQLWQDGYLMDEVRDYTKYQIHNNSDLFFGARGDRKNPWSGSLDEVRFYDTCLIQEQMDALRDNSWRESKAYHNDAVGNMFYGHGIASLSNNYPRYFSGSLHEDGAVVNNDETGLFSENFRIRFEGTTTLYEQKVKCLVKASDYNLTMNPSIRKDGRADTSEVDALAKNPAFKPYVTTVGLYDDELRLLAVAKLAKPLQKLNNVDTTFVVRFDR